MYPDVPLWLSIVLMVGGLVALAWSSDLFVDGAWYCVYMDYKGGKEFRRTVKLTEEFCLRCSDEDYIPEYTDIPDGK